MIIQCLLVMLYSFNNIQTVNQIKKIITFSLFDILYKTGIRIVTKVSEDKNK